MSKLRFAALRAPLRGTVGLVFLTPGTGPGPRGADRAASPTAFSTQSCYLVTAVEHRGRAPESAGTGPTYTNRFACVPADTTYRPRRLPRQFRQVMETAVVTGPAGHEIHTDAHGRVKVQFHWDRDGKRDERSSCWLRVAQSWAGGGYGFQFVPRVGMEVLVGFLGGDPDRPIIVGAVANTTQPVPFPLPENQAKSGIRTNSTPGGGGYNEIHAKNNAAAEGVVDDPGCSLPEAGGGPTKPFERRGIGLDEHAADYPTENSFREDLGLPKRSDHLVSDRKGDTVVGEPPPRIDLRPGY